MKYKFIDSKPRAKGQATEGLSASAVSVIVLILVVAIGATVLQQVRTTQTVNNSDYNITSQGLAALITYSNFFSVIVVVTIFAVVIGLFAFFAFKSSGQGGGL